ncbi:hypothetical protein CR513_26846, partial [Mucuna pruriens]
MVRLVNILNSHKPTSSIEKLNASNHMIDDDVNLLTKIIYVLPCPVGLPNGKNTIAYKEGTINLGNDLALHNVGTRSIIFTVTFVQACKTSGSDSFTVWHRYLGHHSSQIVSLLFSIHVGKKDKYKQNKANERFDLIHYDVWGPYHVRSSCGVS